MSSTFLTTTRRWEGLVGWSSLGAGAIHGGVSPAHFAEWWGYGVFFLMAASAQVVYGLALLLGAIDERRLGRERFLRLRRGLYVAGIVGNLAILAMYVLTRTTGVPLGPERGVVEEVGPIDIASKILEAIVVAGLLVLLGRSARGARTA